MTDESHNHKELSGFLFIGDPHVWSKKPGRRLDDDFCMTVCSKLDEACSIASERGLLPVILGDLFEDEEDSDLRMLTLVVRALGKSDRRPLCIVGNHEKTQFFLTDDTALAMLRETKVLDTIERSGIQSVEICEGKRVGIGGTPYGQDIPEDLTEERERLGLDWLVWVTHHDLAFNGAYPGAQIIREIKGVDLLVNGHMHKTTAPVAAGNMMAFNPGNITRMSADCRNQEPSVWEWRPSLGKSLSRIPLKHVPEMFDVSGLMVEAATAVGREEARILRDMAQSRFAERLRQEQDEDHAKTDDAIRLKEEIDGLFEEMRSDDALKAWVTELLAEVLEEEGD